MKILALAAIRGYQRWISPHKGFCCALRAMTGGDSCSAYGYLVIARFGLRRGLGLLRRRLDLCGHVHRSPAPAGSRVRPGPAVRNPWRHREQGHCDLPCDSSCDTPCDSSGCGLCDLSCELGEARRRAESRRRDKAQLDALARRIAKQKKKQASPPPTPK
jgi:putative component of membrane protein insertase Oxa1/YidC/SpoIIIJ protein YidD